MRKILYFPALMVLGLLIAASSCQSSSSKLSQEQIDSINQMKLDSARIADSIIAAKKHYEDSVKRVSDSIESIKRHDKMINRICEEFQHFVFTDVSDIQRFYSIIDYDARVINHENNIKLKKDLKKKLIAFQVKNYPKARKIWAQSAQDKLWIEDIEVKHSNKTITFIGAVFASNRGIQTVYDGIAEALKQLHFKRVEFHWSKYADEYTYYTIYSDDDDDVNIQ